MNDKELISEARAWAPCAMSPVKQLKLITRLADALEAATRERDAALAAIERCRALVAEWKHEGPSGPFPDRIAIDVGVEVIEPLLAALDGAPEGEGGQL